MLTAKIGLMSEVQLTVVRDAGFNRLELQRHDLRRTDKTLIKRYPAQVKIVGMATIMRFLHATEVSDYSTYPAYPIDRAVADQRIDEATELVLTRCLPEDPTVLLKPTKDMSDIIVYYCVQVRSEEVRNEQCDKYLRAHKEDAKWQKLC